LDLKAYKAQGISDVTRKCADTVIDRLNCKFNYNFNCFAVFQACSRLAGAPQLQPDVETPNFLTDGDQC
jgi:hypothetical protein